MNKRNIEITNENISDVGMAAYIKACEAFSCICTFQEGAGAYVQKIMDKLVAKDECTKEYYTEIIEMFYMLDNLSQNIMSVGHMIGLKFPAEDENEQREENI